MPASDRSREIVQEMLGTTCLTTEKFEKACCTVDEILSEAWRLKTENLQLRKAKDADDVCMTLMLEECKALHKKVAELQK